VRAIPNGTVSNYMVRLLAPGTLLHLDQASGDFVLPGPLPDRTLLVTAGSGITPVMGLLRNHLADLPDVVLVHSAPTAEDVIFGDQIRDWARTGRLRLVERHTATTGILDPAHLEDLVPDWRDREAWTCGPIGLLDAMEAHWTAAGFADRLHIRQPDGIKTPTSSPTSRRGVAPSASSRPASSSTASPRTTWGLAST
jgi:ferredoxin-NADP reductase